MNDYKTIYDAIHSSKHPIASDEKQGEIKIGDGLTVTEDGILSAASGASSVVLSYSAAFVDDEENSTLSMTITPTVNGKALSPVQLTQSDTQDKYLCDISGNVFTVTVRQFEYDDYAVVVDNLIIQRNVEATAEIWDTPSKNESIYDSEGNQSNYFCFTWKFVNNKLNVVINWI